MSEEMRANREYMDCERFGEFVHELDRPGTEGAELREAALMHAESCGRCAALLTETESLDFALSRIATEASKATAPSRMEALLVEKFSQERGRPRRWPMRTVAAVIGVAAALLLSLGLAWHQYVVLHRGDDSGLQAGSKFAKPAPQNAETPEAPVSESRTLLPSGAASASAGFDSDDVDDAEFAQGFSLLPYADDPSLLEGASVVRVILSRSALASLGAPVSTGDSAEQIPADLVVSADGTPEAIRLVAQNVSNDWQYSGGDR